MKKRIWLYLFLIMACIFVLIAYRRIDRMTTDKTPPAITVDDKLLQVSVLDGHGVLLEGVSAHDGEDGDVTDSLVVESVILSDESGMVTVTYAAFDRSGNVAKAQRQVQYTDYESPKFALNAALLFAENTGFDVLSVITAADMLDGDITHWIRATSLDENSIGIAGDHEIEFRVTNSLGETVRMVLPVEVYAAGTYQGYLELTDYLVYLKNGDTFDAGDYLSSYTLSGKTYPLDRVLSEELSVEISSDVDTNVPGIYTVTYMVSCTRNAVAYTGCSKLIVVVEG